MKDGFKCNPDCYLAEIMLGLHSIRLLKAFYEKPYSHACKTHETLAQSFVWFGKFLKLLPICYQTFKALSKFEKVSSISH